MLTPQKPNELIVQLESVADVSPLGEPKRYRLFGLTNFGRLFEWNGQDWQLRSNGIN